MGEVTTIGLDIAKQVFHVHGADASGAALFSRKLTRAKLLGFFAAQPRCLVAMEACGGAHHWGRELERLGHEVRLIPPAYVKPFVKRQKNDAAGCRGDLRGGAAAGHAVRGGEGRGAAGERGSCSGRAICWSASARS